MTRRGRSAIALAFTITWIITGTAAPALKIDAPSGQLTTRFLSSVALTVTNTSGADVSGLQVVRAALVGRDGVLDARFLCLSQDGKTCSPGVTVHPGIPVAIFLMPKAGEPALPNGQYSGTVWLGDSTGNQYDFALKLASTTTQSVAAGLALLTLGAALSWFITRYLRGRAQRNDAMFAALDLKDTLSVLHQLVAQAEQTTTLTFQNLKTRIAGLDEGLSLKNLDKLLPPKLPQPYAASRATQYAAFLTKTSAETAALSVFIKGGVEVLVARWDPADAALTAKIKAALADIDVRCVGVNTVPAAQLIVNSALATVRTAAAIAAKALLLQTNEPSFASIRVEQTATAAVFWLLWLVITVVAGYSMLILYNPGFGETGDWLKCFLWGLGFHIAGGQIQNLTAATSSTVFNVNVPKVTA